MRTISKMVATRIRFVLIQCGEFAARRQQYLHKEPNGYCGIGGTGLSCPIGVAPAE